MLSTTAAEKAALRKSVKDFYLSDINRQGSDRLLLERFLALPQLSQCACLLLFYPVGQEPDITLLFEPLLQRGKELALPCCLPGGRIEARRYCGRGHLSPGAFGIPQPDESCPVVPRERLDLILTPNLCCDRQGHRLGHGGGYYDRYLSGFGGWAVALCRDELLLPRLPVQPHDCPVDLVVTQSQSLSVPCAKKERGATPLLM